MDKCMKITDDLAPTWQVDSSGNFNIVVAGTTVLSMSPVHTRSMSRFMSAADGIINPPKEAP